MPPHSQNDQRNRRIYQLFGATYAVRGGERLAMQSIEKAIRWFDRAHRQAPVAVAALILLAFLLIGASWTSIAAGRTLQDHERWYTHTYEVLAKTDEIKIAALNVMRGERGYALTDRPEYLEPYLAGSADLLRAASELASLTADNESQRTPVQNLAKAATRLSDITRKIVETQRRGDQNGAIALIKSGQERAAILEITASLSQIEHTERELLKVRDEQLGTARDRQTWLGVVVAVSGICTLALALLAISALRSAFARESKYRQQLRTLAETDDLTGIANRREAMAALDRAIADSRRRGEQLAVAVLDIDHFKRVNDTYGHGAGDEVIRRISRIAAAAVRSSDLIGRIGGEEFLLVLPGASVAKAYEVCERLRQHVQEAPIDLPGQIGVEVTISTGIARLRHGEDSLSLIERADEALYAAKNEGRDQVRLAA